MAYVQNKEAIEQLILCLVEGIQVPHENKLHESLQGEGLNSQQSTTKNSTTTPCHRS